MRGLISLEENPDQEPSSCSLPDSPLDMRVAIKFNLCMQSSGGTSGVKCVGHSSLLEMPLLVSLPTGQEEKCKEIQRRGVLK